MEEQERMYFVLPTFRMHSLQEPVGAGIGSKGCSAGIKGVLSIFSMFEHSKKSISVHRVNIKSSLRRSSEISRESRAIRSDLVARP